MRRLQNNAEKDSDMRGKKKKNTEENQRKNFIQYAARARHVRASQMLGKIPLLSEWDDYSSHSSLGYTSGLVCMTYFITEKSRKNIEAKSITILMMLNNTTDRFLDIKLLDCRREEHY